MTEFNLNPDDIAAALRKHVEGFKPNVEQERVGRVLEVADGVARVQGLPGAAVNELLEFEGGVLGLALNLDEDSIGAVVLGTVDEIEEGQSVKATGRILSVPVGDALVGRVVNALGLPDRRQGPDRVGHVAPPRGAGARHRRPPAGARAAADRHQGHRRDDARRPGSARAHHRRPQDRQDHGRDRHDPEPEGSGREVHLRRDRPEGLDGRADRRDPRRPQGAMEYTVVVNAPAADEAVFKYLAPYAGCAMGQHWMENGEHALVVYDDLSKQAEAYRQISLLLRRPPGREAYPGDVFYLHSRLLERAAKLSDALGAGSLTALPIIETKAGDVSAYIPTNVISITDGQIYLVDDLFKSGVRPAVDVGISVSRVGGAAQIKAMKTVAGTLKLDLAQFRELEAFATFGSELDAVSKAQLERGYRLVELLKQPLNSPMPVEEQVVSIFAGTTGVLDDLPVGDVKRFESELLDYFRGPHADMLAQIRTTGAVPEGDTLADRGRRLQGPVRRHGFRSRRRVMAQNRSFPHGEGGSEASVELVSERS